MDFTSRKGLNVKLLTKTIHTELMRQYPLGSDLDNQIIIAKVFNPCGAYTAYLLNADPAEADDPDYLWGIVKNFEVEMGSISLKELEAVRVPPFGLPLERDLYFKPIPAKEVWERLLKGEHI
jgi:hypothetical protein